VPPVWASIGYQFGCGMADHLVGCVSSAEL
jgi:hypothetical protein